MKKNKFPNGITDYLETHHEVVAYLTSTVDNKGSLAFQTKRDWGAGGLYELAEKLTDEFEKKHKGEEWIEKDYFVELEKFITGYGVEADQ